MPYDPSAIITPANGITIARLALTPFLLVMILADGSSWPAFVLGFTLAATDGLDGYLARKYGATRSGAFLDPIADKVLALGAMGCLVLVDILWVVPVAIIAAREAIISAFRSYWARRGRAIHARRWAKIKTVSQDLAAGLAVLPLATDTPAVYNTVLWIAVALTVITGVQYIADGRQATSAV